MAKNLINNHKLVNPTSLNCALSPVNLKVNEAKTPVKPKESYQQEETHHLEEVLNTIWPDAITNQQEAKEFQELGINILFPLGLIDHATNKVESKASKFFASTLQLATAEAAEAILNKLLDPAINILSPRSGLLYESKSKKLSLILKYTPATGFNNPDHSKIFSLILKYTPATKSDKVNSKKSQAREAREFCIYNSANEQIDTFLYPGTNKEIVTKGYIQTIKATIRSRIEDPYLWEKIAHINAISPNAINIINKLLPGLPSLGAEISSEALQELKQMQEKENLISDSKNNKIKLESGKNQQPTEGDSLAIYDKYAKAEAKLLKNPQPDEQTQLRIYEDPEIQLFLTFNQELDKYKLDLVDKAKNKSHLIYNNSEYPDDSPFIIKWRYFNGKPNVLTTNIVNDAKNRLNNELSAYLNNNLAPNRLSLAAQFKADYPRMAELTSIRIDQNKEIKFKELINIEMKLLEPNKANLAEKVQTILPLLGNQTYQNITVGILPGEIASSWQLQFSPEKKITSYTISIQENPEHTTLVKAHFEWVSDSKNSTPATIAVDCEFIFDNRKIEKAKAESYAGKDLCLISASIKHIDLSHIELLPPLERV